MNVEVPCKIGDTVFCIRNYHGTLIPMKGEVSEMYFMEDMQLCIVVKHIGRGFWNKKIFQTKEEAKRHLEKYHDRKRP